MIIQYLKERVSGAKPKVSRAQVLASRPMRNPQVEWERRSILGAEDDTASRAEVALLRIPRRRDRFGNLVAMLFQLPDYRKLELDEIGADVWEMCDGTHTVDALTRAVCTKYRLNRRQAETSVTAYLKMLAERRLIVLRADNRTKASGKPGRAAQGPSRRQKQT